MRARGVEDVRRCDACKRASPGDDGPDHAAGAACNELVTGFDHIFIWDCGISSGSMSPSEVHLHILSFHSDLLQANKQLSSTSLIIHLSSKDAAKSPIWVF
jgi:hypothetical protein